MPNTVEIMRRTNDTSFGFAAYAQDPRNIQDLCLIRCRPNARYIARRQDVDRCFIIGAGHRLGTRHEARTVKAARNARV